MQREISMSELATVVDGDPLADPQEQKHFVQMETFDNPTENKTNHNDNNQLLSGHKRTDTRKLFALAFQSIGIIYGDLGTSPIYTPPGLFSSEPSQADIYGTLSIIFWSINCVVLLKYVCFVLLADDHGEGGTFALFAILQRELRTRVTDPVLYNRLYYALCFLSAIGACFLIGDGVLNPPISILSAIGGITVVSEDLTPAVVPISVVILIALFFFQQFGTTKVSFLFSPILTLWFFSLSGIGIYNITQNPDILRAFSPYYVFRYFIDNGTGGWEILGSVVLALTGVEALYADMGHFSPAAVRISSCFVVYPSIILAYTGQLAVLSISPDLFDSDLFFTTIPTPLFYPMLVLATAATIIASESLICAVYTIIHQAYRLGFFPRVRIVHTGDQFGQVYIPEINYILMVVCVIITIAFENSNNLSAAFGLAVSFVFGLTTILYSLAIVFHFKKHWAFAVFFFLFFGLIDFSFLTSTLFKFTQGAWLTLLIGILVLLYMMLWHWGHSHLVYQSEEAAVSEKELFYETMTENSIYSETGGSSSVARVRKQLDNTTSKNRLSSLLRKHKAPNSVVSGLYLFYSADTIKIPASFAHLFRLMPVRPDYLAFVTILHQEVPHATDFGIAKICGVDNRPNVYRAIFNCGYSDPVVDPHVITAQIVRQIAPEETQNLSDKEITELVDPTYLIGSENVIPKASSNFIHKTFVYLFGLQMSFSRSPAVAANLPSDSLLQIGMRVPI